jgi:hypothetical protein
MRARTELVGATDSDGRPGVVSRPPSGHDASVVGDDAAVVVGFQGMIDCARAH